MPINIPSGLYTGGRATFDTSPMLKAISDLSRLDALERKRKAAEEKAAREAIEKNYERMQNAVNVAGVRNVDIDDIKDPATGNVIAPGLKTQSENLLKKWTAAGRIDPMELTNFKFLVEKSKGYLREGEKMHQGVVSGKLNPKKGDVDVIAAQGLSMFDPNFKPYTEADMPASIPDLDEDKWNAALFKDTQPTTQVGSRYRQGGSQIEITYGYSKKDKKNFGDAAASKVGGDPSAEKYFTEKMNDPSFRKIALPLYQQIYGKNEDINTPQKAAAASAIMKAEQIKRLDTTQIHYAPQAPKEKTPAKNILDEYNSKLGINLTANVDLPYGIKKGQNFRFVPVQEIDSGDRKIIQSGDPYKGIPSNDPISIDGRMGYIVKTNGWQGTGFTDANALYGRQKEGDSGVRASGKGKGNDPLNTGL